MTMKRALGIILAISLFGVVFSGVLSYRELFAAAPAGQTCPAPGPAGTILGYPACIYGFFMYMLVAATAFWGLLAGRKHVEQVRRDQGIGKGTIQPSHP